jgi:RES domain-containing protein
MSRDLEDFFEHAVCPAHGRLRAWRVALGAAWTPGEGAGRWNRDGDDVLYASTTAALATLEALAHLQPRNARRVHRIAHFCIDLQAGDLACLDAQALPADWKRRKSLTRAIGAHWLREHPAAALLVPSALAPGELNVLIDPRHPRWRIWRKRVASRPLRFDPRLIERATM